MKACAQITLLRSRHRKSSVEHSFLQIDCEMKHKSLSLRPHPVVKLELKDAMNHESTNASLLVQCRECSKRHDAECGRYTTTQKKLRNDHIF